MTLVCLTVHKMCGFKQQSWLLAVLCGVKLQQDAKKDKDIHRFAPLKLEKSQILGFCLWFCATCSEHLLNLSLLSSILNSIHFYFEADEMSLISNLSGPQ